MSTFTGTVGADIFNVTATGSQIGVSLNGAMAGTITGVDPLTLVGREGGDTFNIGDLSGAAAPAINIDLSGATGGPDGAADTVRVSGTLGADSLTASHNAQGDLVLTGGAQPVTVHGADNGQIDYLQIGLSAGNDVVNLSAVPPGGIGIGVFVGAGDDTVVGATAGALDYVAIHGDTGNDSISAGSYNNVFGETGNDTLASAGGHNLFGFMSGESGQDLLLNFHLHSTSAQADTLYLGGFSDHSFDDLVSRGHLVQSGNNVLVADGVQTIVTLQNVQASALSAADFIFTQRSGAEVITGSSGGDVIRNLAAHDTVLAGAGDDLIAWGGGADSIDGGAGLDSLTMTGTAGNDQISLAANGARVVEQLNGVTTEVVGVETITVQALGGADAIRIGDFSQTDLRTLNIDLSGANGAPDDQADSLTFNGSAGASVEILSDNAGSVTVDSTASNGVVSQIHVTALDALDRLTFSGTASGDSYTAIASQPLVAAFDLQDGADTLHAILSASTVSGGAGDDVIRLESGGANNQIDAGTGADTVSDWGFSGQMHGGDGNDALFALGGGQTVWGDAGNDDIALGQFNQTAFGGDGDDTITAAAGFRGNALYGGAGNDIFKLQVSFLSGAPSPVLGGGSGFDQLDARTGGANQTDHGTWANQLTASGGTAHLHLLHAGVNTDLDSTGVESISFAGGNGSDQIQVGDLSGTAVTFVGVDLGGGGTDGVKDVAILEGAAQADNVAVSEISGDLVVSGLPATVVISHIDPSGHDEVFISTNAGNDVIDLRNMKLNDGVVVDAGVGDDTILAGLGAADFVFDTSLFSRTPQHDQIIGFLGQSVGGHDHIVLGDFPDTTLSKMIQHHHILQSGGDVVITDDTGAFLTLTNTSLSSLTQADFIFG